MGKPPNLGWVGLRYDPLDSGLREPGNEEIDATSIVVLGPRGKHRIGDQDGDEKSLTVVIKYVLPSSILTNPNNSVKRCMRMDAHGINKHKFEEMYARTFEWTHEHINEIWKNEKKIHVYHTCKWILFIYIYYTVIFLIYIYI